MEKNKILDLLEESGLEAYKDRFDSLIFPSFEIELNPEEDSNLPISVSKIGGKPDLDADMEWPKWKGYNMSFVAQINLTDLPHSTLLPPGGLLSFFYAIEPMYEEGFYDDPTTCRVIYTPAERLSGLARKPLPALAEEAIFKPNRISFLPKLSIPASESAYLESMGLGWDNNREQFNKYWRIFLKKYRRMTKPGDFVHRLLGHPDQIQGDMQVACEIKTTELTYDMLQDSVVKERTVNSALKWRLLLQIDSEEEKTGIMFGDVGRVYFWIREDDLAIERFDRVVCEMQCC